MNQSELPPTDHVARVLLKMGARDAALNLLRAAVTRDPGEMACAALLKAVEARPDSSVYGPDMDLNVSMARTYARRGWIIEAICLLEGARLTQLSSGRDLANELYEILGPIPEDAPADLRDADEEIRRGAASVALMTFDEYVATGRGLPAWAERRHHLLSQLLLDAAPSARPSAEIHAMTAVGEAMQEQLRARDLPGALEVAKRYFDAHPRDSNAHAVIVALGRIVDAMGRINAEVNTAAMRTQPMTGINVALFQVRMCNFDVAERMFRKLVISDPMNERARAYLDDVQTVKKALGAVVDEPATHVPDRSSVDPLRQTAKAHADDLPAEATRNLRPEAVPVPGAPILEEPTRRVNANELRAQVARLSEPEASVPNEPLIPGTAPSGPYPDQTFEDHTRELSVKVPGRKKKPITSPNLLKKSGRPSADGWGADNKAKASDWEEVSTEIGDPDKMAELMLKQGYAERALRIYERLARVYPDRERYARRAGEIRDLIDSGAVPQIKTMPGEDVLSTPDEPADSVMSTMDDGGMMADPRVPAAGAAIDALAPPMEEDIPIDFGPSLPATADHAYLRKKAEAEVSAREAAAEAPLWEDEEEPTIVGESVPDDDVDEDLTTMDMRKDEVRQIVAAIDAESPAEDEFAEASPDKTAIDEAPSGDQGDVIVRRVIAVR